MYYDAQFIRNPWTCLWSSNYCSSTNKELNWNTWLNTYDSNIRMIKLNIIKVQLSCAAIMLALNVLFILIYFYTSFKVIVKSRKINSQATTELIPQQQSASPSVQVWSAQSFSRSPQSPVRSTNSNH